VEHPARAEDTLPPWLSNKIPDPTADNQADSTKSTADSTQKAPEADAEGAKQQKNPAYRVPGSVVQPPALLSSTPAPEEQVLAERAMQVPPDEVLKALNTINAQGRGYMKATQGVNGPIAMVPMDPVEERTREKENGPIINTVNGPINNILNGPITTASTRGNETIRLSTTSNS
jgi:hypothetical protein